ncbi:Hypothetical predicted protein [Olea europaea subsp. europaea]|uniref:Transmembrane protein n=1 Tax=Olea europaea subsp. europaea TaxID=158383 RepID=A0A8S0SP74_OLEEU|nr:Hypothetical predicted protein [Olea europaea subsp. europaea]
MAWGGAGAGMGGDVLGTQRCDMKLFFSFRSEGNGFRTVLFSFRMILFSFRLTGEVFMVVVAVDDGDVVALVSWWFLVVVEVDLVATIFVSGAVGGGGNRMRVVASGEGNVGVGGARQFDVWPVV